jgi:hypothetical protein
MKQFWLGDWSGVDCAHTPGSGGGGFAMPDVLCISYVIWMLVKNDSS